MLMPLRKYAQFRGRSRRAEYWWFTLAYVILLIVVSGIDMVALNAAPAAGPLYYLFVLATLVPSLAVGVRRLHDTNRSGWWILLSLIPLVNLVLLYFLVQDGTRGENRFGPSPKHADVASTFS